MIDCAKRLFEVCRAVSSYHQQTFRYINAALATNTIKALAYGLGDSRREAFPGQLRELLGELIRLFVFYVHAHFSIPFYHSIGISIPNVNQR